MRHPFIRTLAGQKDPYFKNTTLLLHGDGTNGGQNNTFVDGSTNNFTITRNGNTTQGTFSPYGDNWSNYFDGTGDYLQVADNAALEVGSSDFTVECWAYLNALPASNGASVFAQKGGTSASNFEFNFRIFNNAGTIVLQLASSSDGVNVVNLNSSGVSIVAGTWYHFAVTKSGTDATLWINGASAGTSSSIPSTIYSGAGAFYSGANNANANLLNGYISNLRLVKGTAVYTAAFTPPTTPLTAITNTSLLTCQSNRFRDASTNNFTVTRNGDVSVQRFSPFSPTAAYAAGTIGGSGYFDGTGDFLRTSASSLSSSSFTIECWILYTGATNVQRTIYDFAAAANGYGMFVFHSTGGNIVAEFFSSNATPSFASISASFSGKYNQWVHLAVSYDGSTYRMFFDGVSVGTPVSSATNVVALNTLTVGARSDTTATQVWAGYISNFRYVTGAALYTSTFTPSTSPLGIAGSGTTQLLLNFTNAAILDNAMMAVPETVGNAQISTSVKKYGTGSFYFDGTGDYLQIAATRNLNLSSGDWTVECWWNPSANVAQNIVMVNYNAGTDGYAHARISTSVSPNKFYALSSSTGTSWLNTTGGGSWSINNWYHLAFVRNGSTFTLFVNGTSVLSYTSSSTLFAANGISEVGRTSSSAGQFYYVNGYIDDLRITKGVARYTANFIPPTAPFPDF